ncbi:MAG: hypothetical protein EBZ87_05640 [Microbacteriaceae bacterium]|nr:hypothetical protein [Microbacteriaceae bacterium]
MNNTENLVNRIKSFGFLKVTASSLYANRKGSQYWVSIELDGAILFEAYYKGTSDYKYRCSFVNVDEFETFVFDLFKTKKNEALA